MNYPTLPDVELASKTQLGIWLKSLPSPGMSAVNAGVINNEDYEQALADESAVLDLIKERHAALGGWKK